MRYNGYRWRKEKRLGKAGGLRFCENTILKPYRAWGCHPWRQGEYIGRRKLVTPCL